MPKVNLISERRKSEKRQIMLARVMLYGCGLLAALFIGLLVSTTVSIRLRQSRIDRISQDMGRIQPTLLQVKSLQDQIGLLEPKLKLLQTAKDSTMHWYLVFQQTGQGLPTTSWLDSLNIAHDDKTDADTLTLQGQSYNSYTVADTLRQLQNQPWFSQVNLQLVSSSPAPAAVGGQLNTINPVHFEIVVQVVAPSQQTQEQNSANNNSAKVQ